MTMSRAPKSPTVREFEATVAAVDGRDVELEETYFYPEGGGQPADRGTIDGTGLETVQKRNGTVVHTLASEPSLESGDEVDCTVDDAFRTYCMRAHTASHVVYGAGRRLFDGLGYAGFDIGEEKVRIDLTTAEPIDDDDLVELGRLSNRAVWDARSVTWERLPESKARDLDGIAFNEKTEEGAMADYQAESDERVRVVTVDKSTVGDETDGRPWDVAACGGTHVDNTRQIGPIEVLDRSNPGEGITRVEFSVGPAGIDHAADVQAAAREASRLGGVPISELPDAVSRLQDDREQLEYELEELKEEVVTSRLSELPTVERDGATWAVGTLEGIDSNAVSEGAREVVGEGPDEPDVVAAVDRGGAPSVVVASTGEVDAGEVIDGVTDAFGGGGGGSPTAAQGGGLQADPEEVVTHLRGE
ncbi:alanyl-tRNA editing protein [Natronobacterium texcoconense]|uniref:Alanyl-tRNA synthetase n=1 Tax=Natronobacterium texcoconense TaxID=1095778 RepID=A0A1H1BU67_NATTX|nr:DHHA1 domain-containing protein [Natronobacterium texcoconense]SDQ55502.1 alanyl-tRNA synthetase [Natronobacterium texcoconense]